MWNSNFGEMINDSRQGGRAYPDPFVTYATLRMPRTIEDVLRWSEGLWNRNGTYAEASRRVVRYFLTKIDVTEASDDEKDKYNTFLNDTLGVMTTMAQLGDDFMCYGNSFSSLYVPFRRFLRCEHCGVEQPLNKVDWTFKSFKFEFNCQNCSTHNVCKKPIDRRTMEEKDVKVIRWPVHQIKIKYHPLAKKYIYLWEPPATFKRQITSGDPFVIEYTPWEIIESIKANKLFEFAPDVVYHMREEGLCGLYTNGWGVTRFMTNFTLAFHAQMLKLYNEILATEYIVPFRVITPSPQGQTATDPMISTNLGSVGGRIQNMLRDFRKKPGGWNWLPFPVEYQALGGEGMQMATSELINQALDEMLNAAGVPAELYKGTLQIQAMPTALRLFQQSWPHYVSGLNGWLGWLMEKLAVVFNWEPAKAKLQPVTLADNLEDKQILLQLAAANQVSKRHAFAPLGIDPDENQKEILDEQASWQELQQKYQKEQQQKAMLQEQMQSTVMQTAGAMPGGGGGSPEGMQVTPGDIMAQADQMTQQLLTMSDSDRRSELLKIKKADPTLHSLIRVKLEEQRGQAERIGGQQVIQQMAQQQTPQQA